MRASLSGSSGLRGSPNSIERALQTASFSEAEIKYFVECENAFLAEAIVQDGMISKREFAETYVDLCSTHAENGACPSSIFSRLPRSLQIIFYEAVCKSMPNEDDCVFKLNSMPMDIGYIVSKENRARIQMHVETMCLEMLNDVFTPERPNDSNPSGTPQVSSPEDSSPDLPPFDFPVDSETGSSPQESLLPQDLGDNSTTGGQGSGQPNAGGHSSEQSSTGGQGSEQLQDPGVVDNTKTPSSDDRSGNKFGTNSGDSSFSNAPIIGVAAAAGVILLLMFFFYRRRKATRQDTNVKHIADSETGSFSEQDPEAQKAHTRALIANKSSSNSNGDWDAIGLKMSNESLLVSRSSSTGFLLPSSIATVDQIEEAVDNANWDEVYKIASILAEQEDLSTLSSAARRKNNERQEKERMRRRSHLSEEDYERTRNLDELVDNRDWTGVCVTAALYAGESGYSTHRSQTSSRAGRLFGGDTSSRMSSAARRASSIDTRNNRTRPLMEPPATEASTDSSSDDDSVSSGEHEPPEMPLLSLKDSMDQAVDAGDWDQVLQITSGIEQQGNFKSKSAKAGNRNVVLSPSDRSNESRMHDETFQTLTREMDIAMAKGDWALVGLYADKIRELKIGNGALDDGKVSSSRALVPLSRPTTIPSVPTGGSATSLANKHMTLAKLVEAEKWKGVSIMAGLYEMEAKGSVKGGPDSS